MRCSRSRRRARRSAAQLELEVLTRDAELRALRAQINPHFLYNSLNSISALTAADPSGARRMCVLLGEFLRDTLSVSARERIPLADELALADRFLSIEQVRFGARLQVDRRIDRRLGGLPGAAAAAAAAGRERGHARDRRTARGRRDPSRHLAPQRPLLDRAREPVRRRTTRAARAGGVGLDNVRRRLAATFGRDASMEIARRRGAVPRRALSAVHHR